LGIEGGAVAPGPEKFFHRQGFPKRRFRVQDGKWNSLKDLAGQVVQCDRVTIGENAGPFDGIFKLTDITRPRVTEHCIQSGIFDVGQSFPETFRTRTKEIESQIQNIFGSLAQRRRCNADDIQAIEQIFPEFSFGNQSFQVLMSGGDQTNIHLNGSGTADRLERPFLQHAQELDLGVERNIADFIEKQRPSVGGLKTSDFIAVSSGERPLDVSEQLAFEQSGCESAAVNADQRSIAAGAVLVNGLCQQFLARSTLAANQDGRLTGRDLFTVCKTLRTALLFPRMEPNRNSSSER
jgi:hypothetical protein